MTIYIDNDYKCHTSPGDGFTSVETDAFDGKCRQYIEGYRFVPSGQSWTREDDWTPDTAVSLFAKVLIPDETVIPEWEQPGSANPYMAGDKVKHNGKTWVSDIDNNVWEPGVYGWTEASDVPA